MTPLRVFLWRFQKPLAAGYIALLGGVAFALWFYWAKVPASIDTGLTVAMRSLFHSSTFADVDRARADLQRAAVARDDHERTALRADARARLEAYLDSQPSVQPDRLHTQAVVAATELLAELHAEAGRHGRAQQLLSRLASDIPNNYRLHWLAGRAAESAGDLAAAAVSLRAAFKLAVNHADVAEDYLEVLSEQNAFEDILWVAREFVAGVQAGRPMAELKVGVGRSATQRKALEFSGVPVEHGNYVRAVTLYGLSRGPLCRLVGPPDLFEDWSTAGTLFVLARFEGVYDGVRARALHYVLRDGTTHELVLSPENSVTYHRPHSGVEAYVEIRTDIDARDVAHIEIEYACREQALSKRCLAIVERARVNVGERR